MKTVKMLKAFLDHKAGDILDLEDAEAKSWIDTDLAKEVTGDPVKDAGAELEESLNGMVQRALTKQLAAVTATIETADTKEFAVPKSDKPDNFQMTGGYKSFPDFAYDIFKAGKGMHSPSDSLRTWMGKQPTGMSEGVAADGGVLVPQQYRAELLEARLEASIVRPRATFVPMRTNSIRFPAVNVTSTATSTHGGIVVYRPGEGEEKHHTKPGLTHVDLTLTKLIALVFATDELLEDSMISLQPLLTRMCGEAIAFQEDDDYLTGTGVGQPQGVLSSPALVVQPIEAGQAVNTILYMNVARMWARLYSTSKSKAVWVVNNDVFPMLTTMVVPGTTVPIWVPGFDAARTPNGMLFGRPLFLTEKVPTLGQQGDIGLYDFSQYLIGGKPGGVKADTSIHLRFDFDETAFRFVLRHDGKGWWPSAITPRNGTSTTSPFVVLGSRSES